MLVAHDRCVGAITRVAPPGEWRTNVSLGARRVPVEAPERAVELALAAARALDATLVGVDLLPIADGDWVIIEVNGAVEFTRAYGSGTDVFTDVVVALVDAADAHRAALPLDARRRLTVRVPPADPCYTARPRGGVAQLVRAAES